MSQHYFEVYRRHSDIAKGRVSRRGVQPTVKTWASCMHGSQEWQMLFNVEKCKLCIHIGFNNENDDYFLGEDVMQTASEEEDLGVAMHHSVSSPSVHCALAVRKANQVLGLICKVNINRDKFIRVRLFFFFFFPGTSSAILTTVYIYNGI